MREFSDSASPFIKYIRSKIKVVYKKPQEWTGEFDKFFKLLCSKIGFIQRADEA